MASNDIHPNDMNTLTSKLKRFLEKLKALIYTGLANYYGPFQASNSKKGEMRTLTLTPEEASPDPSKPLHRQLTSSRK